MDSRDLIEKRDDLDDNEHRTQDEEDQLLELNRVIEELNENCDEDPDNGITLVPENDWVDYVIQYIDDCYGDLVGTGKDSDKWPYCHIKVDYEAAAEALKDDYIEVTYQGTTYLCR